MKRYLKIFSAVMALVMIVGACKSTHRADFNPIKRKSVRACPSF
jgi:hypothetical protein